MFRRGSYAQVASGSAGNNQPTPVPARSGAFSHLANSGSNPHSISHSRHSRSVDADGHHNSMSTSLGRSGPLPSYSSQFGYLNGYGATQEGGASTLFVPSYLRGSKHAEKLEEVHKARIAAQREYRSTHSSNAGSLSTSSSSVNLHKMAPSHRGLTHEIIERAPIFVDEPVAPWPTRWNDGDKYPQMEVEDNGRQAKFAGSQKTHDEAASVRADYPMPRQCGIYYYEVTVVSKGKDGCVRFSKVSYCGLTLFEQNDWRRIFRAKGRTEQDTRLGARFLCLPWRRWTVLLQYNVREDIWTQVWHIRCNRVWHQLPDRHSFLYEEWPFSG